MMNHGDRVYPMEIQEQPRMVFGTLKEGICRLLCRNEGKTQ